jgi:hypothetical protein
LSVNRYRRKKDKQRAAGSHREFFMKNPPTIDCAPTTKDASRMSFVQNSVGAAGFSSSSGVGGSFNRLRERERFRAWLVRMTFRLALDRIRSKGRRERQRHAIGQLGGNPPSAAQTRSSDSSWLAALPERLAANASITASFSQTPVVGLRFTDFRRSCVGLQIQAIE